MLTTCVFALVVICAVLALGGTGMCTDGARLRERKWAQRGVRRQWATRVADVPPLGDGGQVKLQGIAATDGGELRAPFSGRACVAYELTLFDFEGVRPVLLARETMAREFLLRDASGVAHVVPEPARIGIEPDKRWRFESLLQHADGRVAELLRRHGLDASHAGQPLVICEGVIAVGGAVAVLGRATREPDPAGGATPYRTLGTRPLVTGSAEAPLLLVADE